MALAEKEEKVVGITAAMPSGTGLNKLMEVYPDRFWDVAIAEQHAVTSAAALAKEGFKPFVAIYSTFLQRGFDQIVHDVAIADLPVVFAIDRAGVVGEDGETHQGFFDISYLRLIPNLELFAPRDEATLHQAVAYAASCPHPCAFRYPRGSFAEHETVKAPPFERGKGQLLKKGSGSKLLVGYGSGAAKAMQVAQLLEDRGESVSVVDLRFVKPLDETLLSELAGQYASWFVISDSVKSGGVTSAVSEFFSEAGIAGVQLKSFEYPDRFVSHGATKIIESELGILPEQIADRVIAG